jgi:hypothetical protein
MGASPEVKAAAMKVVMDGLRNGDITVQIVHTCSWCKQKFTSDESFDNHLIDGKTIDPATGKPRRICPN